MRRGGVAPPPPVLKPRVKGLVRECYLLHYLRKNLVGPEGFEPSLLANQASVLPITLWAKKFAYAMCVHMSTGLKPVSSASDQSPTAFWPGLDNRQCASYTTIMTTFATAEAAHGVNELRHGRLDASQRLHPWMGGVFGQTTTVQVLFRGVRQSTIIMDCEGLSHIRTLEILLTNDVKELCIPIF